MATLKQIKANRRNALKSTGPITPAGKQIVSQNAIQHGLLTASPVVFPEEQPAFDYLTESVRYEYAPYGVREHLLIERMIDCLWRLQRASRIETGIFIAYRKKQLQQPEPVNDNAEAYEQTLEQRSPGAVSLGDAYTQNAGAIARLGRHERHIERSYQAALRELQGLQYARTMQCDPFFVANMRKFRALESALPKRKEEGQYRSGPASAPPQMPSMPEPYIE